MKLNKLKEGKQHKRGRPPTRPAVLKDGFYIEVRNRATDPGSGIKIGKATEAEMLVAIEEYRKIKLVVVLGEYRNGEPVKPKPVFTTKKKKVA